jgi:hypothetical protein
LLEVPRILHEHTRNRNLCGLRKMRACCEARVEDAEAMGWRPLADSWQRDLDSVIAALKALGEKV